MINHILFVFLMPFLVYANNSFIEGRSKFISQDEDSYAFVKEQLLAQAFYDVFLKSLNQMGLDTALFEKKFNEAVDSEFQKIDEKLKTKFKIDTGDPTLEDRVAYQNELRQKKFKLRNTFGDLASAITSYTVKTSGRSTANPKHRFMTIEAKTNSDVLGKIYFSFIKPKDSEGFGRLYLNPQVSFVGLNPSDLKLESLEKFTSALFESWLQWFHNQDHPLFKNAELIDEGRLASLQSEKNSSVVLKFQISVERVLGEESLEEHLFRIKRDGVLVGTDGAFPLFSFQPQEEEKSFILQNKELGNLLANYLYRIPLGDFASIKKPLLSNNSTTSSVELHIQTNQSFDRVQAFIDSLILRGGTVGLKASISEYTETRLKYSLNYSGEWEGLISVIRSFDRKTLPGGTSVHLLDAGAPIQLKIN